SFIAAQDNLSCGAISAKWLDETDRMATAGECAATVMAPISSISMKMAGVLDRVVNVEPGQSYLFLISGPLRVMHLTDHMPLRQVCDIITRELVTSALEMLNTALQSWGIDKPRIVVAGLNPHASGTEEEQEIAPGVAQAHQAQEARINLVDDLELSGQKPLKQAHVPAFQCFRQQGVVRVAEAGAGDRPGHLPFEFLLIDQEPHQFGHGDGRVRVIQLNRKFVGEGGHR
ncbi:MAG: hypothetical protein EBZ29_10730, partial [Synechococcaceae bacterium WB9_4xC_028]|nr:hypothetical protein [Synechococcaceae bacterium WB9_4xC_028]